MLKSWKERRGHKVWRTLNNKWFQWFAMLIMVSVMLPYNEGSLWWGLVLVYVIFFPSIMFINSIFRVLRFNYFPSPVQLWKGFRRQWRAIEKGPVVVRVHRKKPSST